jgi:16S rRNA (adenine1518-N6/adenine1519-N6)-dimethyltransferase
VNQSPPPSITSLLAKYNLFPKKGLGQNFLVDPHHLEKIVAAAELTPADTVLEIGPGPGALTRLLAQAADRVIAVELDSAMVHLLQNEFGHLSNLTIIEADILQTSIAALLTPPPQTGTPESQMADRKLQITNLQFPIANLPAHYKVVANLPYYITSAVLRHVLEPAARPQRVVVTVQKEVAQRIVAQPGQMSVLAVSVQYYGQPTLMHKIPAGAFYPPPKVDSAVVRIDTFAQPPVTGPPHQFFEVVKAGFSQKRKQLKNSLAAGLKLPAAQVNLALTQAGINPARRAETLSLAEWGWLAEVLRAHP